jgi:hypothetical protein
VRSGAERGGTNQARVPLAHQFMRFYLRCSVTASLPKGEVWSLYQRVVPPALRLSRNQVFKVLWTFVKDSGATVTESRHDSRRHLTGLALDLRPLSSETTDPTRAAAAIFLQQHGVRLIPSERANPPLLSVDVVSERANRLLCHVQSLENTAQQLLSALFAVRAEVENLAQVSVSDDP